MSPQEAYWQGVSTFVLWNSLQKDVVVASGLVAFKRGLDKILEEKSIIGYMPSYAMVYAMANSMTLRPFNYWH